MATVQPDGAITRLFPSKSADIKYAADGASIFVSFGDTVQRISTTDGQLLASFTLSGPAGALDLSADGRTLAVVVNNPSVPAFHLIDTATNQSSVQLLNLGTVVKRGLVDVAWLDNGKILFSQGLGALFEFDPVTGAVNATNATAATENSTLVTSSDHSLVYGIAPDGKLTTFLYSSSGGQVAKHEGMPSPYGGASSRFDPLTPVGAISPNEATVVRGDALQLFNSALAPVTQLGGLAGFTTNGMVFSPAGDKLYLALRGSIVVVDMASQAPVAVYPVGDAVVSSTYSSYPTLAYGSGDILQISTDGRFLAVLGQNGIQQIDLTLAVSVSTAGDDVLDGSFEMLGLDGNDTMSAPGAQVMAGGAGDDIYYVDTYLGIGDPRSDRVIEWDNGGRDKVFVTAQSGSRDILNQANVEELEFVGADNVRINGTAIGEILTGGSGDDLVFGNEGDDTLNGGNGADVLAGGNGADVLNGGAGNDRLISGSTTFVGSEWVAIPEAGNERDVLNGGDGDDIVSMGLGDVADGGAGFDTIELRFSQVQGGLTVSLESLLQSGAALPGGGSAINFERIGLLETTQFADDVQAGTSALPTRIVTLGGNDIIRGGSGQMIVDAGDGDDILISGSGDDILDGGAGNNLYFVNSQGDDVRTSSFGQGRVVTSVSYGLGAFANVAVLETIELSSTVSIDLAGNNGPNTLYGNQGRNILTGGAGDDKLWGYGGDDFLLGGTGGDSMWGGAGNDTYYVDNFDDRVFEDAGAGFDRVAATASFQLPQFSEVELIEVLNITGMDNINLGGSDYANTLVGGEGTNVLFGGGGDDILIGNGGNDRLDGGTGRDVLIGGTGNDRYIVDDAGDIIIELAGEGRDVVSALASFALTDAMDIEVMFIDRVGERDAFNLTGNFLDNEISGNQGANILNGMAGNDSLAGFGGNDFLIGGAGDDSMYGGLGNDTFYVDSAADMVFEAIGAGADRVATSVSFVLDVDAEIEQFEALDLYATQALDLTGSNSANAIGGNFGANTIDGRGGSDTLTGFGGADRFVFSTALDAGNIDRITDFEAGVDHIVLDHSVFAAFNPGTLDAATFAVGGSASGEDSRIIYDPVTGALLYDTDGTGAGAAVQFATLSAGLSLTASDFAII